MAKSVFMVSLPLNGREKMRINRLFRFISIALVIVPICMLLLFNVILKDSFDTHCSTNSILFSVIEMHDNRLTLFVKSKYCVFEYSDCVGMRQEDVNNTPGIIIFVPDEVYFFPDKIYQTSNAE